MGIFCSSVVAETQFLGDSNFPQGGETQKMGDSDFPQGGETQFLSDSVFPQGGESRFFPFFDDSAHGICSFRRFLMIPPTEFAVFSDF